MNVIMFAEWLGLAGVLISVVGGILILSSQAMGRRRDAAKFHREIAGASEIGKDRTKGANSESEES